MWFVVTSCIYRKCACVTLCSLGKRFPWARSRQHARFLHSWWLFNMNFFLPSLTTHLPFIYKFCMGPLENLFLILCNIFDLKIFFLRIYKIISRSCSRILKFFWDNFKIAIPVKCHKNVFTYTTFDLVKFYYHTSKWILELYFFILSTFFY